MTTAPFSRSAAALLLAGSYTALTFGALAAPAPVAAQQPRTATTAQLAEPAQDKRIVAGNTLWSCNGTACITRDGGSRPMRLCRDLKRKAGTVTAFTVNGLALDSEALARCNA